MSEGDGVNNLNANILIKIYIFDMLENSKTVNTDLQNHHWKHTAKPNSNWVLGSTKVPTYFPKIKCGVHSTRNNLHVQLVFGCDTTSWLLPQWTAMFSSQLEIQDETNCGNKTKTWLHLCLSMFILYDYAYDRWL